MSPPQERNPVVVFLGWLLMAIGGLIVVTAGACSAIFTVSGVVSSFDYLQGLPSLLLMVLILGGIPVLVGIGLFLGGRALARPVKLRPIRDPADRP